jgi:glycosyltransferase involved in cell wall biosynthesis
VSAPAVAVRARRADRRASMSRVGWITYDSFAPPKRRLRDLESFTRMRVGNIAEWINANSDTIHNELYRPGRRYDVVVFQKMMDARCQAEARALRASGTKIVFDANVNYYESWGDYFVPGTHPTDAQQRDAIAMTRLADQVVADSSYLAEVIHKITPRVVWIPDNVDIEVYRGIRAHGPSRPVRLVWSGVGKKAAHLLLIRDALAAQDGIELLVVAERPPEVLGALDGVVPWRFIRFSDAAYARTLLAADIIVSPKRLVNAYEMGHTEYKITLGMAVGLPAIASPQPSYVEALAAGGGIIADTAGEWRAALDRLVGDHALRASMGAVAHRTVRERYSTPVVAAKYLALLEMLVGAPAVVVGESA